MQGPRIKLRPGIAGVAARGNGEIGKATMKNHDLPQLQRKKLKKRSITMPMTTIHNGVAVTRGHPIEVNA